MPTPKTPHEAVLNAARDVTKLDSAYEAELLGSALLGSVYAVAEANRAGVVQAFVGEFLVEMANRRDAPATAIRSVFAALVPDAPGAATHLMGDGPAPSEAEEGSADPPWLGELGRVRLTGCYAYGDVYGDQTSYVTTFAYHDPERGGPEHAVVVLVDHNIGIVKDIFIGGPVEIIVGQIRDMCAVDETTWFDGQAKPELIRREVTRHLEITDSLGSLPGDGSLATDRALAGARLAQLPKGEPAEPTPLDAAARDALTVDFLASPEAAESGLTTLNHVDRLALDFSLSLLFQHADTFPDLDPLRWSPVMVELLLLDWVHRRAVLDDADATMLPRALRAWVRYAARRKGLPPAAVDQVVAAVDELTPQFAQVVASGERRSPEAQAVADLMADGVDPADADAVKTWLHTNTR